MCAKSRFVVMRIPLEEKQARLMSHLQTYEHCSKKTIIFVSYESEMVELMNICNNLSIDYICFNSNDLSEFPSELVDSIWKNSEINNWKVVIVTDNFNRTHYRIKNAEVLIHYSLPHNWSTFSKRFAASFNYYKSLMTANQIDPTNCPKAVIMMDQDNLKEIPKMINFLKDHRLVKSIPADVLTLIDVIIIFLYYLSVYTTSE